MSNEAKKIAIANCDDDKKELSNDTSSLLLDITDKIWVSSKRVAHNISLNFKVFEVFPIVYYFQYPIFLEIRRKRIVDPVQKEIVWRQLVKYLSSEDHYANPVKQVLWNYYFKDERTAKDSWQGLINAHPDRITMLHIIEVAACVSWDLKEPVYYSLLDDKNNHSDIFDSIFNSAFVEGGKIDKVKAYSLLKKISIDPSSLDYRKLSRKIKPKYSRKHASLDQADNAP